MEFHVKNPFIKRFLSQFPHQNELKILKYLTLVGIQSLMETDQQNISYSDLQRRAKEITKSVPKEEKEINQELKVIKAELAKLNEKFEDKLKVLSSRRSEFDPESHRKVDDISSSRNNSTRPGREKESFEKLYNSSGAKEDRKRAISTDNYDIYPAWWGSNSKPGKSRYSLTPKPTEIAFPSSINPQTTRNTRNTITRHHLDDSEAKQVLSQVSPTNNVKRAYPDSKEIEKYSSAGASLMDSRSITTPSSGSNYRKPPLFSLNKPVELNDAESVMTEDFGSDNTRNRSPQFAQTKEEIMNNLFSPVCSSIPEEKENTRIQPNTFGKGKEQNGQKALSNSSKNSKKSSAKKSNQNSQKLSARKNRTENPKRKNGFTISHAGPTLDLRFVESKIKDKVDYHKEISRQNKHVRNNSSHYSPQISERNVLSNLSSFRNRAVPTGDKFVLVEKEDSARYQTNHVVESNRSRQQNYYENPTPVDTYNNQPTNQYQNQYNSQPNPQYSHQYSNQYSNQYNNQYNNSNYQPQPHQPFTNNYYAGNYNNLGESQYSYNPSSSKYSNVPDHIPSNNNEDFSSSRNYVRDSQRERGILDIANNFLNSPLMQHIASFNGSASTSTSKELGQSTMRKEFPTLGNESDPRSPNEGYQKAPFSRNDLEEDQRQGEIQPQYRYSDAGMYKPDTSKMNASTTTLKDSIDKRYSYYPYKESRILHRDESSSLASSYFSNFLNEEMKGFYQKEVNDIKNSKPKIGIKIGSSENSSNNVSFNGNEPYAHNGEEHPTLSRKSTYYIASDGNKSYDASNVFRQDMISAARFPNNA